MKRRLKTWSRPADIWPQASLWGAKGVQPHGIMQGILGDCWFLAAASALGEWPDRVKALFKQQAFAADGVYDIDFYVKGKKLSVKIDDKLPTEEGGSLLNSRQSKEGAFWFVLLEKAYAKLNLNYASLNGGGGVEAFRSLTGMPVDTKNPEVMTDDALFDAIAAADGKNYAMTAGCSKDTGLGLVTGHLYTVLGAKKLSTGEKLVKLRNPWGMEKYTGPWNDNDAKWTDALKKEVGLTKANDGIFWMTVKGFKGVMASVEFAMV